MREGIMLLSSLYIKKLYGKYNYDVQFNSDVTLLYGMNGCGKTTILNIITAIITGNLQRLYAYDFEEIKLSYFDETKQNDFNQIFIVKSEDCLSVSFKGNIEQVSKLQIPAEKRRHSEGGEQIYFETYPILSDIKKEFNYVYLALNRAMSFMGYEDYFYIRRNYYYEEESDIITPEKIDQEIRAIENLIMSRYTMASSQTNKINNNFRNSILKSALDVNIQTDLKKVLEAYEEINLGKNDIFKIRDSYVKILSELDILSDEEKKEYEVFFQNYSKRVNILGKNKGIDLEELFSLFIEYNEMKKIEGIVNKADETEKQKAAIMKPVELFTNTVNDFLSSSDCNKKIGINMNGHVYFTVEDSEPKLSVQYLSSGERQILTFFANLIFRVSDTSSGIFVVDEPELSLHLSWQKVFVQKALEINNNVQFIFATHSPEIVGRHRDKTKKLQRVVAE